MQIIIYNEFICSSSYDWLLNTSGSTFIFTNIFFQGEVAPAVSLFMFWLLVSRAKSDEDES